MSDRSMTATDVSRANLELLRRAMSGQAGDAVALMFDPGNPLASMKGEEHVEAASLDPSTILVDCIDPRREQDSPRAVARWINLRTLLYGGKRGLILVHGYDDDPRDIWRIPEVVDWFREFVRHGGASALILDTTGTALHGAAVTGALAILVTGFIQVAERDRKVGVTLGDVRRVEEQFRPTVDTLRKWLDEMSHKP